VNDKATKEAEQAKADAQVARDLKAQAERKLADAQAAWLPKGGNKRAEALPKVNQVSARGCEGGSGNTLSNRTFAAGRKQMDSGEHEG